ncbi:MAG: phycobilisome maturation protein [Cyanobacteria bacterium QS_8_64_29]|nr:MAG: phycobilisome maturation protein [Cyanobacteria bacterium QS_8_64_29]
MGASPVQERIQAIERADSHQSLTQAVWALAADPEEAAIPTLIEVLGYNNPGAAVAAVEGLVRLGEAAVPSLLAQLDGYDYGARAWAIRALARIGDPRALAVLLEAAGSDFALSVRRAAATGLGHLHWSQLAERERERAQLRALGVLLGVAQDPEWVVRYAAIAGLQALATAQPQLRRQAIAQCARLEASDSDAAVRARAALAREQLQPGSK